VVPGWVRASGVGWPGGEFNGDSAVGRVASFLLDRGIWTALGEIERMKIIGEKISRKT